VTVAHKLGDRRKHGMRISDPLHGNSRRAVHDARMPARWLVVLMMMLLLALLPDLAPRADAAARDGAALVLPGRVVGVIDGDTLDVRLASGVLRVRLHGIDAPERGQPWGDAARRALSSLAFGRDVELEPIEQDRYDRQVARVWLDGRELNVELLRSGHAWVYRRYADNPRYCELEAAARESRQGLWGLSQPDGRVAPWEWRQRKSLQQRFTDYSQASAGECIAELRKAASR
jgi:endonuclease YncB( thermonuclease family)